MLLEAGPFEVLVPRTVKDLLEESSLRFSTRRVRWLKGVQDGIFLLLRCSVVVRSAVLEEEAPVHIRPILGQRVRIF